jgi:hypothetical protein
VSVRHPRTRLMTFATGNRGWLRAFVLVERRELTLSFEHIRITTSIQIARDTKIHLVARVEIAKVSGIANAQNHGRDSIQNSSNKFFHKIMRAGSVLRSCRS